MQVEVKPIASEMLANKKKDMSEFDLDLSRFHTEEEPKIKVEYFERMNRCMKQNCLKAITLSNQAKGS